VLLRHGETTWVAEDRFQGWKDPPLSDLGERQAALAAQRLADASTRGTFLPLPHELPVGIWHSPLARAERTAALIAERLPGVTVTESRGLLEIGQGEWEGRLNDDVAREDGARLAAWRRDATSAYAPGGESLEDATARVRTGLAEVLRALEQSRGDPWAILVGHGGSLRLVLLSALDLALDRYWSFDFAVCAISVIRISGGRATLMAHNVTDHLAPLVGDPTAAAEARGERSGAL
jgi:broad specificity phosphatase PhoE